MTAQSRNYHWKGLLLLKPASLSVIAFLWLGPLYLAGCAGPADAPEPLVYTVKVDVPPLLVSRAERDLGSPVTDVGIHTFKWSSKKIFVVYTKQGGVGTFMEKDRDFVQVNSPSGTSAINEVLRDYRFTRQDFADAFSVYCFLDTVALLYEGESWGIGSSVFLGTLGGPEGVAQWARHSKKREIALREICRDPQFVFDGESWVVTFNVFRPDGGVDQWKVEGEFSPATQSNAVHKVDKRLLKKRGTFAYMMIGG